MLTKGALEKAKHYIELHSAKAEKGDFNLEMSCL